MHGIYQKWWAVPSKIQFQKSVASVFISDSSHLPNLMKQVAIRELLYEEVCVARSSCVWETILAANTWAGWNTSLCSSTLRRCLWFLVTKVIHVHCGNLKNIREHKDVSLKITHKFYHLNIKASLTYWCISLWAFFY